MKKEEIVEKMRSLDLEKTDKLSKLQEVQERINNTRDKFGDIAETIKETRQIEDHQEIIDLQILIKKQEGELFVEINKYLACLEKTIIFYKEQLTTLINE
ncbi:MAG: hypothetical protein F6K17_01305 [Okeania sp. SIO3C4]|nr:hypothetical protein [Okeania sp. SIO3C4]